MSGACLVLLMAGGILLPVDASFPDTKTCNEAAAEMTDGQTVRAAYCLPGPIVDGIPAYDCHARAKSLRVPAPEPKKFQGRPLE